MFLIVERQDEDSLPYTHSKLSFLTASLPQVQIGNPCESSEGAGPGTLW